MTASAIAQTSAERIEKLLRIKALKVNKGAVKLFKDYLKGENLKFNSVKLDDM